MMKVFDFHGVGLRLFIACASGKFSPTGPVYLWHCNLQWASHPSERRSGCSPQMLFIQTQPICD